MSNFYVLDKNLESLLMDNDSYFKVPDYQRPYSWTKDEVADLWKDIYGAFKDDEDSEYFLGSIILSKNSDDYYDIIDGQQRLVTITILLSLMRDYYWDEKDKKTYSFAIKNENLGKHRIRIMTSPQEQARFRKKVQEHVEIPDLSSVEHPSAFDSAILYFKEELDDLKNRNDGQISDFTKYLMKRTIFIKIVCEQLADAVKLFQVLNTRGLELTNSDLIHSYLYHITPKSNKDVFNSEWQKIVDTYKKTIEVADEVKDMDEIMTLFAYYYLGRRAKKSIYEDLSNEWKEEKKNSIDIVLDISEVFDAYFELASSTDKALSALFNLRSSTYWQAILVAAKKTRYLNLRELAVSLRNFYYAYWIAGSTASKTRDLSIEILEDIKKNKRSIEAIKYKLSQKIKNDNIYPQARKTLTGEASDMSWVKPVLVLLEYNMTDSETQEYFNPAKLELEHVLPVEWNKVDYWRSNWNGTNPNSYVKKLGNLTLLDKRKNIAARNFSFVDKREVYLGNRGDNATRFFLTKEITQYEKWTKQEVDERQERLVKEVKEILEIPDPSTN